MKYIKKFENYRPGPNTQGSKEMNISSDKISLFTTEPILKKLIGEEKISLIGNTIYWTDESVEEVLNHYFSK